MIDNIKLAFSAVRIISIPIGYIDYGNDIAQLCI